MRGRLGVLLTHYIPRLSTYPLFGPIRPSVPIARGRITPMEGTRRVLVDILPVRECGSFLK